MDWLWPQRLELRQLLARGWLGELYLAQDLDSPRQVVTRLLNATDDAHKGALTALLQLGATTQHPHILPTTLPEQHGENVFYSMQFAEAGSLRSLFERYRTAGQLVDPVTLLDIIQQVGQALAFAHQNGIWHGNLKPENVLLQPARALLGREGFNVLVSDFGLNSLRHADPASPYLGAPQRGGQTASVSGDLYSVGAMLFEGLRGSALPLDPTPADLESISPQMQVLVGRCLGWPEPLPDMGALLALLNPEQSAGHAVQFRAETPALSGIPGETLTTRLRLQAGPWPLSAQFLTEGLPEGWADPVPAVQLQAHTEAAVTLNVRLPREASVRPERHRFRVLALQTQGDHPVRLAELALTLQVQAFYASQLELQVPEGPVGRTAAFDLRLHNAGNTARPYEVQVHLSPGTQLTAGTPVRPVTLPPGGDYHETVAVRFPESLLTRRQREVSVLVRPQADPYHEGADDSLRATATLTQRPRVPGWAAVLALVLLLGGGWWASQPPQISQFAVSGTPPVQGEPFTLSWQTSGVSQVRILEFGPPQLLESGQLQVPGVEQPQTYTLVARRFWRQAKQQLTVNPLKPAPHIATFTVTPRSAALGEKVQVSWQVLHAASVQLAPFGIVPPQGKRTYTLTKDTTFDLSASAGTLPSEDSVRSVVKVKLTAPSIEAFTLTPEAVRRGEKVTMTWQVAGAKQVRLSPLGNLPPRGTRTLIPQRSGVLTLKASNGQQEVSATASVTVTVPRPQVTAFTITPARVMIGRPVQLRWQTSGAQQVELRWGDQQQRLPTSGELTLLASAQMERLSLFATNATGEAALITRELRLTQPPQPKPAVTLPSPVPLSRRPAPEPPEAQVTLLQTAPPEPVVRANPPAPPRPAAPLPPPKPAAPAVQVVEFQVQPQQITLGDAVTFRWAVKNERQVILQDSQGQSLGTFPAQGAVRWTPKKSGPQVFLLISQRTPTQRASVSLRVNARNVPASAPAAKPQANTPAAPIRIGRFSAHPAAVRPGERSTLTWTTSGVKKVYIKGLSGPNPDGSFPPSGTVSTPQAQATLVYTLKAGTQSRTLRVPLLAARASASTTEHKPPTTTRYGRLAGDWKHSSGQLKLQVEGNRVSGTLLSSQPSLPSEVLRGVLSGDADHPTMTGFVGFAPYRVAVILQFDPLKGTFNGFYSTRTSRQKWCGWRESSQPPDCQ